MENDAKPVLPVTLEFNGVLVQLSLPSSKRARVQVQAPVSKPKPIEPFEVKFHEDSIECGNGVHLSKNCTLEVACDFVKQKVQWQLAAPGQVGYTVLVLKQVHELLHQVHEDLAKSLNVLIINVQDACDGRDREFIHRVDSISGDTFLDFIDGIIEFFDRYGEYNKRAHVSATKFGYKFLKSDARTTKIEDLLA
jgi:hypothetical protein